MNGADNVNKNECPILYSYWRSSCSWRVRIALNLKGIPYQLETDWDKITKNIPFGLIPALYINGELLAESLAIIEYLDEAFPNTVRLLPEAPMERAKVRILALQIIANTQPLQTPRVQEFHSDSVEERERWARHWIILCFTKLEEILKETSGRFSYGDQITLLDLCIPPQVFNAHRYKVDLTPFPTIVRLNKILSEIPEFKTADARYQPDTPENERTC
ncbi:putative maleylacetoacetate isomerase [Ditylenchus destructor]|uniref:maleylacetoacetate isomerase n=1 Tax=Ditylenchus destructor TaxID=166010 RepID=A0AAD4R1D3_9BILA|nr:putative maleylacetoacetate isomerase [Ditylenchus destructor]